MTMPRATASGWSLVNWITLDKISRIYLIMAKTNKSNLSIIFVSFIFYYNSYLVWKITMPRVAGFCMCFDNNQSDI